MSNKTNEPGPLEPELREDLKYRYGHHTTGHVGPDGIRIDREILNNVPLEDLVGYILTREEVARIDELKRMMVIPTQLHLETRLAELTSNVSKEAES